MSNQLNSVKELEQELIKLNSILKLTREEIITISKESRNVREEFSKISTPKELSSKIDKITQGTQKLNSASNKKITLDKKLEDVQSKLTVARSKGNKALIEEKVKIQQVNSKIKEAAQLEAKLTTAKLGGNKAIIAQKVELQKLNANLRVVAKLSSSLSSEYEKQNISLNILIKRQRDLALRQELGKRLTLEQRKELKKLTVEIQRQQKAFLAADASSKSFVRSIGNYPLALSSAAKAARSLASSLGLIGGAFFFVRVMKDALKTLTSFEKTNATLSGVLQKSSFEIRELTEEAKRLGEVTVVTASQVTGLQLSYARLGFSQQNIIDLTEATIKGSVALNAELSETATLTGGVVNSFTELSALDSPRIIDVLSLSTAKSALDFEKLSTALPIVGGAASAIGVPFEELVSLLAKLSDATIDTSTGATALRNIFIRAKDSGKDFRDVLLEVSKSQDQLTAASNAFGVRAAVSSVILSNNISEVKELNTALNEAAGTAKRMADKELNTAIGAFNLFKSAAEGIVLSLNENNKITNTLRDSIRFLAENLKTLASAVFIGLKVFLAYKLGILAVSIQQRILNIELVASRKASLAAAFGISKLRLAWVNFSRALRANILGVVVTGILLLVDALDFTKKSLSELSIEINDLNKAFLTQQKAVLNTNKSIESLLDTYDALSNKAELSESENKRLKDVIVQIGDAVPAAIIQVDLYGDALEISSKKAVIFVEENEKLSRLRTNVKLKEQAALLLEIGKELEAVNTLESTSNTIFIEGVGAIRKVKGELFKYTEAIIGNTFTVGNNSSTRIHSMKLTEEENILYLETVRKLKLSKKELEDQIELNKELILNLSGLSSERQKEAKRIKEKIENDKKLASSLDDERLLIPKLTAEIKELRLERKKLKAEGISVNEEARLLLINKEIKALQSRIKAVKDENKSRAGSLKKLLESEFELSKFRLKSSIDINKSIVSDEKSAVFERISASTGLQESRKALLILERDFSLNSLNQQREDRLKTGEDSVSIEKEISNKIKIIKGESSNDLLEIEQKGDIERDKIHEKVFKKRLEDLFSFAEKSEILIQDEVSALQDSLREKGASEVEIEEAVRQKISDLRIKQSKDLIDFIHSDLSALALSAEQRFIIEKELSRLKADLSDEELKEHIKNENKKQEIIEEALSRISKTVSNVFGIDSSVIDSFFDNLSLHFKKIGKEGENSFKHIAAIAEASFGVLGEASDAVFEGNINKLNEELQANTDFFDGILSNEELSETQISFLEEQRDLKEKELQDKKNKEIVKQAKATKIFNVGQIVSQAAVASISALAAPPVGLGPAAGGLLIPFIIASAAIQTAAVLSQPLPKFAEGGEMERDGLMMINDHSSGRTELVERKGELYSVDQKNAIVLGEKGDVIHKDKDKYLSAHPMGNVYRDLQNYIIKSNVLSQNVLIEKHDSFANMDYIYQKSSKKIVEAINNQSRPIYLNQSIDVGKDLSFLMYKNDIL